MIPSRALQGLPRWQSFSAVFGLPLSRIERAPRRKRISGGFAQFAQLLGEFGATVTVDVTP